MISPKPLVNGYYLHQLDYPEHISLFPGNKINEHYLYDVDYPKHQKDVTRLFYLSTDPHTLSINNILFCQKENMIPVIQKKPDILICTDKSLSALFFYFKRIYRKTLHKPIILIQTNILLPFHPVPSQILVPQLPSHIIAAVPYFEDLNIPSRLLSTELDFPGWQLGTLDLSLYKEYIISQI